jgi:hypothetical protein
MWPARQAAKINVALGKIGYSDSDATHWWNEEAYSELSGSPAQAWSRGEFDLVKSLVERIVSTQFASQLADNPTILKRLEESKRT